MWLKREEVRDNHARHIVFVSQVVDGYLLSSSSRSSAIGPPLWMDGSIDELSMKTAGKTSIHLRVSRIMMRLGSSVAF